MEDAAWYVDAGGGLDTVKLLAAFQAFFREHSEHWVERFAYREAGPQLLLQAFLQRIVNGGGRIEREYGLGRGRTDILVQWPRTVRCVSGNTSSKEPDGMHKYVVECKALHKGLQRTIEQGLQQTAGYMDRSAAECGHLVIFDRDPNKNWKDKIFHRTANTAGVDVHVWGM